MNPSEDAEHIHNGFLTIGDQKKGGTHISFKDKCRRYFVLRCIKQRLLTLSGYKNVKDFTSSHGHIFKNVEQIVLTKDSKIHSMYFPVKKHKQSNVLCILKDKQMTYLEADSREELDAWCKALNDVFVRLGWKENPAPSPLPSPPPISASPTSTESSQGSYQQPSVLRPNGSTTDLTKISQPYENRERAFSHPERPSLAGGEPSSRYELPSKTKNSSADDIVACCARAHVTLPGSTNPDLYVNIHNVPDKTKWLEETQLHHERLISIRDIYANLPNELAHPEPPQLPPRTPNHKRSGTFPGAHTPPSSPLQSPRHSSQIEKSHQSRCQDAENVPIISLPDFPAPLFTRRYPHLFDDSEAAGRKISLPQPLNLNQRRNGNCLPGTTASPPESPVMLRKAGSHSNLSLNLTNRPLPSPVKGDTFDFNTLRWEIGHKNGFPVVLAKDDLQDKLGLVRIGDYVWIAGWKLGRSELNKKLHVGDQLRQINEQIVVDPFIAHTLFTTSAISQILLIIRRLPHAKVRHLHRSTEAESWGFEVEGNRVVQVSTRGPASDAKMTPRAQGAFSERLCDWIITEIDGEPVSLLGKKDEVKNRMASAGLELTLTIQPDDFIKRLKAELQKVKFYHEFFVGSDS